MQDGSGTKEKTSLGTSRDAFALRFSVNQGFRYDRPEMSSLVFCSAVTKAIPRAPHRTVYGNGRIVGVRIRLRTVHYGPYFEV